MYQITEEQINLLSYILEHLTVTGPVQGGLLNNAAGVLAAVQGQKAGKEEERKGKTCQ